MVYGFKGLNFTRSGLLVITTILMIAGTSPSQARPAGCPSRLWCGCYLATVYGFSGQMWRQLWVARAWAQKFPRAELAPGKVAVFGRGRGGHVGRIDGVRPGEVLLTSGNDGNAIRTRWRSTRGLIAVVDPTAGVSTPYNTSPRPSQRQRYRWTQTASSSPKPEAQSVQAHAPQ